MALGLKVKEVAKALITESAHPPLHFVLVQTNHKPSDAVRLKTFPFVRVLQPDFALIELQDKLLQGSDPFSGQEVFDSVLFDAGAVALTSDLEFAVRRADICVISISSQQLRAFGRQLAALGDLSGKTFVLCMKGLEIGSGKRLSVVLEEEIGQDKRIAVWVGPGHVQDFIQGIPNCMVISSRNAAVTKYVVTHFSSPLIRFYYGADLLGTEIGAAAKNVIGLAAGMLDGAHYASLKGALMARGTRELSRLIGAMRR